MDRATQGLIIGKRYTLMASAASVVLSLGWDLAAVCGLQVKMISEVARLYDVPVRSSRARLVVIGLAGSFTSFSHGVPGWLSAKAKWLMPFGAVLKPAYAAVVTYAMANIVTLHFERGGTLEDFAPTTEQLRKAWHDAVQEGRSLLSRRAPGAGPAPVAAPAMPLAQPQAPA